MITLRIPGVPVAQPRQRHSVAKFGNKTVVKNYTPTKAPVNAYKAIVRLIAGQEFRKPIDGPIKLTVEFVLPRPKSMMWKTRPMPREWHTSTPDEDNLSKSTRDALNGIAWRDDSQVCFPICRKVIASGNESPHVLIHIEELRSYEEECESESR